MKKKKAEKIKKTQDHIDIITDEFCKFMTHAGRKLYYNYDYIHYVVFCLVAAALHAAHGQKDFELIYKEVLKKTRKLKTKK